MLTYYQCDKCMDFRSFFLDYATNRAWQNLARYPHPLDIIGKSWLCSTYVLTRWLHAVFIYTKKNYDDWHDANHEWQESANLKKVYQITY